MSDVDVFHSVMTGRFKIGKLLDIVSQDEGTLEDISTELVEMAIDQKRRWVEMAQRTITVETLQLYRFLPKVEKKKPGKNSGTKIVEPSFRDWLIMLAKRSNMQLSTFYRYHKAGKFYLEQHDKILGPLYGKKPQLSHQASMFSENKSEEEKRFDKLKSLDVARLNDVSVAVDTLDTLEKLTAHAPESITKDITFRVLNGDIKKTEDGVDITYPSHSEVDRLWKIYRPETKPKKSSSSSSQPTEKAIKTRSATNLLLKEAQFFLGNFYPKISIQVVAYKEVATDTGGMLERKRRIDVVACAKLSDGRLFTHGIELKTSEYDLMGDVKFFEYGGAVDCLWLAVTPDLVDVAMVDSGIQSYGGIGLLCVDIEEGRVDVVLPAERHPSESRTVRSVWQSLFDKSAFKGGK